MGQIVITVFACSAMTCRLLSRPFLLGVALMSLGIARCGSDPNLEGARLDLRNKDYDRALENIAKAVEKDPNNSEALLLKGEILRAVVLETPGVEDRAALVEEMAFAFRRSVVIDPLKAVEAKQHLDMAYLQEFNDGFDAYNRAQHVSHEDKGHAFKEAAQLFRNAAVIYPDSISAYMNEASAYYSGGLLAEAVETYEAALSLGHRGRQVYVYLTRVMDLMAQQVADDVLRANLYERAARVLAQGLEHHAEDIELRDMLLNFYALADKPEEALAFFSAQYENKRDDKVFMYNYGTLLLAAQDYPAAIQKLEAAVRLDPSYTKARFNLGAALINEGVSVAADYNALTDSLDSLRGSASSSIIRRMEARLETLSQRRQQLFYGAIDHLEVAKGLAAEALEEPRDICRALFRAYGHTDQRSKADAVMECAALD